MKMCFFIGPIQKDEEEQWREQKFLRQEEFKGKLKQTFIFMLMNGKNYINRTK